MEYTNTVKIPRADLHCHTEYSNTKNLDCIVKLKDLINTANDMGFKGVAITDHECLSGHIKAREIEKQVQKSNPEFKVCLGNEIYLIKERQVEDRQKYYHFILIAKDEIGHKYLRELSTRAWNNNYWERGQNRTATLYTDFEEAVKEKGHLIGSTACLGGYLPSLITQYIATQDYQYKVLIDDFVNWCIDIFGKEDFYFELQSATTQEQIDVNNTLYKLSQFYGIKCILTDDVHYLHKEDRPIHEAFLNSREAERELAEFYEATYFKTDEENAERLQYLPAEFINEMYANSMGILDKVQHFELTQDIIVPERKLDNPQLQGIFEPYYDKYNYINLFAHSMYAQDIFLLSEIEKGFIAKAQEFNEENIARINTELETLWLVSDKLNQRLSAYYNLTQEVIDIMWDDNYGNSLVGVSRGSASGFYICYLMGIVQMNPIKWDLCEWRHLTSSRSELPKYIGQVKVGELSQRCVA